MDKLRDLVGWSSAEELRAAASERGKLLGIGMAMYVEGTGPGPYEGGHVQVLGSGKVLVSTGLTSQGQGHETVFAQIVASELGVPIDDVEVHTGDTRRFGHAAGTFASRAAGLGGKRGRAPPLRPPRRPVRPPRGGDERQRRRAGRPRGAREGDPDRRRGARGRPRGPRDRRGPGAGQGEAGGAG